MSLKISISAVASLVLALVFVTGASAQGAVDATLSAPAARYIPTAADLNYSGQAVGDVAEGDVAAVGTALQYTGVILNGDGVNPSASHPFLKVQSQSSNGSFSNAACYTGNNGGSFGLGFFTLSQQFSTAHMKASRDGSTVTIEFTNVNGGALPNQTYVCTGAPAPVGSKIGVHSYSDNASTIDNFSNGSVVLDTFTFTGTLASSGRWTDAAPGMHANGTKAIGGPMSLSFFTGALPPAPAITSILPTSGAPGTVYVRIQGTNLGPTGAAVQVSGTGVTVAKVNIDGANTATSLTAKFVIAAGATPGARSVTVSTPGGGTSNSLTFTVTGTTASCPVSLPLTTSGSWGNLNVSAGIGNSQPAAGTWVVGWMVFRDRGVSFYGTTLHNGALAQTNPPMIRTLSTSMAPVSAVAVVNAFYNPYLCGYTVNWVATNGSRVYEPPVSRALLETMINSLDVSDFNGTAKELPREVAR